MADDPPYSDLGSPNFTPTEEAKQRLLREKWHSCHSYNFPTRLFSGGVRRKFRAQWLIDKPWMRYSTSKDAVYCVYCCLFGVGPQEKTFTNGLSDWKNLSAYVKTHEKLDYHRDAVANAERYEQIQSGKDFSVNKKISDQSMKTVNKNRHVLKKVIEVILLCAHQNIPLRGHTEENSNFFVILQAFAANDAILAEHLATAQHKYTSPDIQNELLNICAGQVKTGLVNDCRKSSCFAIIVDEATDKSTKEQLSFCVRFIDDHLDVREEFLGFLECESTKGVDLCSKIIGMIQEAGLDLLKIRAQCYDGAANMSGKYRGVQALIRERSPHANYVHCKAHCLNLALVHSSNIPCVRTMMATVQDINFLFDYCAKRLNAFQDELSRDNSTREEMEQRTKLRTLCETRWSSRADALATFKNAFPVVVHALETLQEDGDEKAGQHLAAILRFEFIVALIVAEHMLSSTVALTNLLQKVDNDLLNAVTETKVVIQVLNNERADPAVWDALYAKAVDVSAQFDIDPSRPRRAGRQQHRANPEVQSVSDYWRVTLFLVFADHLVQELTSRVLKNDDRYAAAHLLPNKVDTLQDQMLPSIYAAYAPDLEPSFDAFKDEVTRWRVRWNMAPVKPSRIQDTLKDTSEDLYPCIYMTLKVLLTMPPTSASCERSFSSMKRIKNYLRTTMTTERLSSLAILHVHKTIVVDIETAINVFASSKCRKLDFF